MASPASTPAQTSSTSAVTRPLQAVLTLGVLTLVARLTGLLQRQIISALLPGTETDAYTYAFALPDFLNYLIAGGAISLTFIPIFNRFWSGGDRDDAWRFFSTLASVMAVALTLLTVLMMIFARPLLLLTLPGLAAPDKLDTLNMAVTMTRVILPAQLFFYLGGLLVGVLNTFKRFGATGWTSAVNNLIAIALGLALLPHYGAIGFAWGILLGAFGGNFLLPLLAAMSGPRSQRPRFAFRLAPRDAAVRQFFVLALPIMLGVSLPVVDQFVVKIFASYLADGTVTHLENANRLMIAAQGVLGQAAAVAAFPYLASESASGDYRAFADFLRSGLRRLLFVTLPVSVLMVLWASPLTRLIYGYGQYDKPQKIQETALCLAFYCLGLFAWVGQGLVARGFYALADTRTPTIVGTALTFGFFVPICALLGYFQGAAGLSLSTSVGAVAYFLSVLVLLDKKLSKKPYDAPLRLAKIGGTLLRTGAACALMAFAGALALRLAVGVIPNTKIGDIGLILWSGSIAIFVFAASATRFEIAEWNWLQSKIRRRKRA